MRIRTRLRALILITLLPVAVFGVAGALVLVKKERDTLEQGIRDRVRAIASAIDAELRASVSPLQVLARSPSLDRGDLEAFRAEAQRALDARRGDWANVMVAHPESGEMLLNLRVPPGAPLVAALDADTIRESARSGRIVVSQLVDSTVLKRRAFAVRVPAMREGKAKYVLSAVVETPAIEQLIARQSVPPSWTVAVVDGNYRFVVRRPAPPPGQDFASASLRQALAGAGDGWQRGVLQDGSEIYRAFQRSAISGWATSIAVPRRVVEQGLLGTWLLIGGFVAAAALGLWIAWLLAARITRPIAALAAAAPALGRGDASALPPPGPIDEVRELSRALQEAARAIREREERQKRAEQSLRAADRSKDEFLAMLGHELRNPLASVANAAQLLKFAREQPLLLENVRDILGRQVEHMTRLVDDLLEVGRVTGGKIRLERAPLDLAQVAGQLLEQWRTDERFLHHELRAELAPVQVSADRARIEQVLGNLLDNALKYTPAGGRIAVAVRAQDARAILEVSDTGEGIGTELLGRVFDLFVQGERSLAREPGGLGIGLTLARRLVELHDGTIRAASGGAGQGATFTVELPALERPALATVRPAAASPRLPRRILVVEDNHDVRESLAALLRACGHEVHAVAGGEAALERAPSLAPDVALVDIGLPGIDGYELARRLRGDPVTARIRLIALTGYGTAEDRRRALASGFDEHLTKPVELPALEALLRHRAQAA